MIDQDRAKEQLIAENEELRRRLAALETALGGGDGGLRCNEAMWGSVVSNAPLFIAIVGRDGKMKYLNHYRPGFSQEEVVGKDVCDFLHPEYHEVARECLAQVFRTGEPASYESKGGGPDGSSAWYDTYVGPVIGDGGILGAALISLDNTDRKLAEQRLQKSERLLRTVIDASPESILLLDTNETILLANETSAHRLGRPLDQIIGNKPRDLLPPTATSERIRHFDEVVRTGKAIRFEDRRSGQYYENVMHPVLDEQGAVVAVAVLAIDRTEQKRANEALQRARDELEQRVEKRTAELTRVNEELAMFRRFAEASSQGFSMADLDGHLLYLNPALCRMVGEDKPEDRIGQHLSIYYSEESNRKGKEEIEPALMQNGHWEGELPMLSRQGKWIPTRQNSFLIRDENGNPLRLAVVITDITERKQAEEALAKEHRNLKHLLESSDHERRLIAYEIHDGLAQQLAGAIMQFQTFDHMKHKNPNLAAKAYDAGLTMLQQGHFETRRLIASVRHPILDEEGVVEAIAHLVHEQGRSAAAKIDYRIRVDFDRLAPPLENAIYRIAQEGLTNACRHSKSEKVRVSLLQRGDKVRIEIRDWGIGFNAKAVPKDRFGLEGIRQRARLLGGKCSIRSTAGKGARVTVEMPVVEYRDMRT